MKVGGGYFAGIAVVAFTAVCFSQASAIAANSVFLDPAPPPLGTPVNVGNNVSFDLLMNFSGDLTLGGGVDIHYNPALLSFVGFAFNPAFPSDPAFTRQPDIVPGGILNSLAFGSFSGLSSGKVGTFTFMASAPGSSEIMLLGDGRTGDPMVVAGPFFSAATFSPQQVSFNSAFVNAVPEPEIWGMMLAGLGLIGWRARWLARRTPRLQIAPAQ